MFDDKLVKKTWIEKGKGFSVEIVHWKKLKHRDFDYVYDEPIVANQFNVYAYIFKKHPLFDKIDENGQMYQDVFNLMPLHCGPSYFKVHRDEKNEVVSYQVGSDYHHLYDEYEWCNNIDETPVKRDGIELFNYLKSFS